MPNSVLLKLFMLFDNKNADANQKLKAYLYRSRML